MFYTPYYCEGFLKTGTQDLKFGPQPTLLKREHTLSLTVSASSRNFKEWLHVHWRDPRTPALSDYQ